MLAIAPRPAVWFGLLASRVPRGRQLGCGRALPGAVRVGGGLAAIGVAVLVNRRCPGMVAGRRKRPTVAEPDDVVARAFHSERFDGLSRSGTGCLARADQAASGEISTVPYVNYAERQGRRAAARHHQPDPPRVRVPPQGPRPLAVDDPAEHLRGADVLPLPPGRRRRRARPERAARDAEALANAPRGAHRGRGRAAARRADARRPAGVSRPRDARAGLRRRLARLGVDHARRAGRLCRGQAGARVRQGQQGAARSDRALGDRRRRDVHSRAAAAVGGERKGGKGILFLNARGEPLSRMGAWKILRRLRRPRGDRKSRLPAHAAPLLRDAPARGRRRPARRAGDARPRRHLDDADLHARRPGVPEAGPQAVSSERLTADLARRAPIRMLGVDPAHGHASRHRQLRLVHLQPRPVSGRVGGRRRRAPQRRGQRRRNRRRWRRRRSCFRRALHAERGRRHGRRHSPLGRVDPDRSACVSAIRRSAKRTAARSCAPTASCTARRRRSVTTGPASSPACRRRWRSCATTR